MYWPGYPIKSLHGGIYTNVEFTGHKMHNKITTITRLTLGIKSNLGVKWIVCYSCLNIGRRQFSS